MENESNDGLEDRISNRTQSTLIIRRQRKRRRRKRGRRRRGKRRKWWRKRRRRRRRRRRRGTANWWPPNGRYETHERNARTKRRTWTTATRTKTTGGRCSGEWDRESVWAREREREREEEAGAVGDIPCPSPGSNSTTRLGSELRVSAVVIVVFFSILFFFSLAFFPPDQPTDWPWVNFPSLELPLLLMLMLMLLCCAAVSLTLMAAQAEADSTISGPFLSLTWTFEIKFSQSLLRHNHFNRSWVLLFVHTWLSFFLNSISFIAVQSIWGKLEPSPEQREFSTMWGVWWYFFFLKSHISFKDWFWRAYQSCRGHGFDPIHV